MRVVELRAEDGRAVVAGTPLLPEPAGRLWGLPPDLVDALQEWAGVAARGAASGAASGDDAVAVSRRGRHLAARVSVALRVPVDYVDPVTGHLIPLRAVSAVDRSGPRVPGGAGGFGGSGADPAREATPWGTGLGLAVVVAGLVLVANLALALPLVVALGVAGVLVDVAVVAGLTPALWLNRHAPVWRWATYGTFAGLAATLPALLVAALG